MKLSLLWIFDHIDADMSSISVLDLVDRFNKKTAEIDAVHTIAIDFDLLQLGLVSKGSEGADHLQISLIEHAQHIELPARTDLSKGDYVLVKKIGERYAWACMSDVGGMRDVVLPAIGNNLSDGWKVGCVNRDTILEIDNKSINNRPDLWCHRGFAREIAALFEVPLKPLDDFLYPMNVVDGPSALVRCAEQPYLFEMGIATGCDRIAAAYIDLERVTPSVPWMMQRLACVDSRAINAVVDVTNYVMFDIGQPMHVFDADLIKSKKLTVRFAYDKEPLTTLDGVPLALTQEDIVIADEKGALSLAGVMGGISSSISVNTKKVLIESAHFDPAVIRKTGLRHKIRTEASARFEKNLDPVQNISAIKRSVQIFKQIGLPMTVPTVLTSIGKLPEQTILHVSHAYIETRIGVLLSQEFIIQTLVRLECAVSCINTIYTVTVPTHRATKDIRIKEDLIEEIARYFGYDVISPQLPALPLKPKCTAPIASMRRMKDLLAYGYQMRELYSYALYDESFLHTINWQPENILTVQDPVSENWRTLVTSLIPHLLKAVVHNKADHDQLRFFECGTVWQYTNNRIEEKKKVAGIIFDKKGGIDFYVGKAIVDDLYEKAGVSIVWQKNDQINYPWFSKYMSASIVCNGVTLGISGLLSAQYTEILQGGTAYIFELDRESLCEFSTQNIRYVPISKYPEVVRDVSVMLPLTTKVAELELAIAAADKRIVRVSLLDFFEKAEWLGKKSLLFRFVVLDHSKTLTKQEVDMISQKVEDILRSYGGEVR